MKDSGRYGSVKILSIMLDLIILPPTPTPTPHPLFKEPFSLQQLPTPRKSNVT